MSGFRQLLTPKWMIAHLVVLLVVVLFVRLGFWQLDRWDERRLENAVGESRTSEDPVDISVLLDAVGDDIETLEYRRALATGVFSSEDEVLIRSQVYLGAAGFHVITPLIGGSGEAILVNRGWVPLGLDQVPVTGASPPPGEVTVVGWVHLSQERPPLGPADPDDGRLTTASRVDIPRIQEQTPTLLAPVYLVSMGEGSEELPVPVDPPTFDDDGPHLAYAIQWFAFALIGLVGYVFLVRKQLGRSV
ncbi:MAG: SURF1 family protein [Acidimicrobiia bacterium]